MFRNWQQKLVALLLATILWYLIKEHLRRRGSFIPIFDPGPGPGQIEARNGAAPPKGIVEVAGSRH